MEQMNRSVLERNQEINRNLIYPAAKAYRNTVAEPVRDSIDTFTANLNEPFVFANNVLQLRFPAATTTLGRFVLNSTLGVGGLFDIAAKEGLPRQTGDFGQTLYVWGIRESDYLVVPVVGPTNVRDAFGNGIELGAQLFVGTILPAAAATTANNVGAAGTIASPIASLSKVEEMQELENGSIDFYAMLRSVVEQKRQAELRQALKESLLSAVPGLEDRSADEAGLLPVSPALTSPALEDMGPAVPTAPAGKSKKPETESPAS
jgi:phospholipid-binding lipoprotein MlaA